MFSGPIYDIPIHAFAPHRAVPAPDRLYKVVVWRDKDGGVGSAVWVMPNTALSKSTDLDKYLVPMGEVEQAARGEVVAGAVIRAVASLSL